MDDLRARRKNGPEGQRKHGNHEQTDHLSSQGRARSRLDRAEPAHPAVAVFSLFLVSAWMRSGLAPLSTASSFTTTSSTEVRPGSSNMVSRRMSSMIERRPRA